MIATQLNRRSVRTDIPATSKLLPKEEIIMLQPDPLQIEVNRNEWLVQFNRIWKECGK